MAENLEQRALRADKALKCCENGYLTALVEVNQLISDFISVVLEAPGDDSSALAFVAPGLATEIGVAEVGGAGAAQVLRPRLIRIPAGGALAVGAVLLLSGTEAAAIANQTGALEALSAVGGAFARLGSRTKKRGKCDECIKKALFSQDSTPVRVTGPHQTRKP